MARIAPLPDLSRSGSSLKPAGPPNGSPIGFPFRLIAQVVWAELKGAKHPFVLNPVFQLRIKMRRVMTSQGSHAGAKHSQYRLPGYHGANYHIVRP